MALEHAVEHVVRLLETPADDLAHEEVRAAARQNNLIERPHEPTREQERQWRRFRSPPGTLLFLSVHAHISNLPARPATVSRPRNITVGSNKPLTFGPKSREYERRVKFHTFKLSNGVSRRRLIRNSIRQVFAHSRVPARGFGLAATLHVSAPPVVPSHALSGGLLRHVAVARPPRRPHHLGLCHRC